MVDEYLLARIKWLLKDFQANWQDPDIEEKTIKRLMDLITEATK
jgi:hypothetical protein